MKVAERLLALVREIEVRPGQSAVKLADKFGCSPRTIERDIQERFPELGVVAVNQGGYRFLQKPHLRALALSHEELVSIILAHKVAEPSLDDSTAIALNRVLDKIRSGLSSWDKSTAERLGARTAANPSPWASRAARKTASGICVGESVKSSIPSSPIDEAWAQAPSRSCQ